MKSDTLFKAVTFKATARKALTFAAAFLLASAVYAQSSDAKPNEAAPGTSKVRIVRLSQVKGVVQIDRHIDRGFENAITNLPVVENSQIRTGVGLAEIEFEDNSSLRIAPNSVVDFPRLDRQASGATASTVHLVRGTAYVSIVKQQDKKAPANSFVLTFGDRMLNLAPATHIRLEVVDSKAMLAVLDGTVHTDGENGGVLVPRKKMATFSIFDKAEPSVDKEIAMNVFDNWDHQETSYHANMAAFSRYNSPYAYGLNDMSYYGSFVDLPGCGSMWRPYFASASWNPYSNGTWAWYGGAGYSWVSPYPWAWTPYHTGTWMNCGNAGWGWMPGGMWNGVNNTYPATVTGGGSGNGGVSPGGPIRAPHAPAHPPGPKDPPLIASNSNPAPTSGISIANRSFVFQKDSAGLGVPRDGLGKLDRFSHQAATHGVASTQIYATAPQPTHAYGVGPAAGTGHQGLATTIHRGSPPPPSYSSGSMSSWSRGSGNSGMNGGGASMGPSMSSSMGRSSSAPPSAPVASAPVAVHR
ncbi:FecR family protein [Occallatibacter savannae]|uniref:FecR family protein n=1 Tax=Occallatibacter savannae TaxID=1002691 RepID=UPI0013A56E50|nr:FecR family protein [Occallatibacter savannae]